VFIWNRLKSLNLRQILKLSKFFIKYPLYLIPTYRATKKTLKICNTKFRKEHHLNNKANAFRHALWNFLLCKSYFKISKSVEKALNHSKIITDLHEDLLPNSTCARLMDLHNNKVGRTLFHKDNQMDIVKILELMMEEAIKLEPGEVKSTKNYLVYIED